MEAVPGGESDPEQDGRVLASGRVMADEDSFRVLIKRRPFGRPFVAGDREYLEAISTLASESAVARREVERIRTLHNTDSMTGLPNYRALRAALMDLQEGAGSENLTCLVFMQVQNLHEINQEFSPETGDEVLRVLAKRMKELTANLRGAAAYRIAGDEFGVLLSDLDSRRKADQIAVQIDTEVSMPVDASQGLVAVALGQTAVCADPADEDSLSALVAQADEQMYRARRKYINVPGAAGVDEVDSSSQLPERGPTAALIGAIRDDRLRQVYEPIVDRENRRIVALESSVRYTDPVFGTLPPQFLISEASRLGLRSKMAAQVMEHSVRDMVRFETVTPELDTLYVNISPAQLVDREFTRCYERLRDEHSQVRIVLALDANELRVAPEETAQKAAAYAVEHEVPLALDQFGTGYSEFSALTNYPVSAVVLGQRVLGSLNGEWAAESARRHLKNWPESVRLIAQGVSTEEEVDLLDRLNIQYAQGSLYGNPVSASEFLVRLSTLGLDLS